MPTAWVCANGLGSWSGHYTDTHSLFPLLLLEQHTLAQEQCSAEVLDLPARFARGHLSEPEEVTAAQDRVENFEREQVLIRKEDSNFYLPRAAKNLASALLSFITDFILVLLSFPRECCDMHLHCICSPYSV